MKAPKSLYLLDILAEAVGLEPEASSPIRWVKCFPNFRRQFVDYV